MILKLDSDITVKGQSLPITESEDVRGGAAGTDTRLNMGRLITAAME